MNDALLPPGAARGAADEIARPHVTEALQRALRAPVTLVIAPAGFGKSRAIAGLDAAHVRAGARVRSLRAFAGIVARACAPERSLRMMLDGCTRGAASEHDAAAACAASIAELVPDGTTLVLDDIDDALAAPGVATFVDRLVSATTERARWVLAARSPDAFPLARWMASSQCALPVDDAVLGLRPDDVRRIVEARGLERGAPSRPEMRFATVALACDLLAAGVPSTAVTPAARSLRAIVELVFARVRDDERDALARAVRTGLDDDGTLARVRAALPSAFRDRALETWFRAALRERIASDPRFAASAADADLDDGDAHDETAARAREAAYDVLLRGWDAFHAGDDETAGVVGRTAAHAAERVHAYDVAASAHALAYELARDAGEPVPQIASLEDVQRCAALAGDHAMRAFALIELHRAYATCGDADGMRGVERAVAFLEPARADATRAAIAAGRAAALAWSGAFVQAYAVVAGTTSALGDSAARALNAAEAACYAAAAGRADDARAATAAADAELYQVTESAARDRANATLALAATLLGDDDGAVRRLPRMPTGTAARRTATLLDAAAAFHRQVRAHGSRRDVDAALDRARARGFGGFARLVDALRHGTAAVPESAHDDAAAAAAAALVDALERHDPDTAEHARNVSQWCARIAARLGFDADGVRDAARCGLVHDVGKLRVPASLLDAPRALEPDEIVTVRTHAALGAEIVDQRDALGALAPLVRAHHERVDGRGYPDGLAGDAIPRVARIVAVADAFDAMVGRRPYREPRTPAAALLELHRERGRQFDADAVDAMIAVVESHA